MDNKERRKLAEISLIYGIPIITNAKENSRLAGLQRKLQRLIVPDLLTLSAINTKDSIYVDNHVEKWLKDIGWWGNSKHVASLISFCLDMIENSPFNYNPKIIETLQLIAQHLEVGNKLDYEAIQAGTEIADKWQAIYA